MLYEIIIYILAWRVGYISLCHHIGCRFYVVVLRHETGSYAMARTFKTRLARLFQRMSAIDTIMSAYPTIAGGLNLRK